MLFQNGAQDVKSHKYFRHLKWEDVYHRKLDVSAINVVRDLKYICQRRKSSKSKTEQKICNFAFYI